MLHREYPFRLYCVFGALTALISALLLFPVIQVYIDTGLVPRFPTLIVGSILMLVSLACLGMGLILKEITNNRYEMRYLHYLAQRV